MNFFVISWLTLNKLNTWEILNNYSITACWLTLISFLVYDLLQD